MDSYLVDIIPKAKGLRLSINANHSDLDDPKGITEDFSDRGRWGNGDVSVQLNNLEDLAYIVGLIRQAYLQQNA